MSRVMRFTLMVVETVLVLIVVAPAQMQSRKELLSVQDHRGQANVIRFDGRVFVEVQDLAAIARGSLRVEKDTVICLFRVASPRSIYGRPACGTRVLP